MILTKLCMLLFCAEFHIHIDHLNITADKISPDCIIEWIKYKKWIVDSIPYL